MRIKTVVMTTLVVAMMLVAIAQPAFASGSEKNGWYHAPIYYTQGVDEWMYCEDMGAYLLCDYAGYDDVRVNADYPNIAFLGG